ncbi:MAG TPA: helix-turn-helix transcriptional regulator [Bacteroidia bacterium]|nr:helix-turn-helix transcriptional regulator [Bacteroidia bacterium]
MKPPHSLSDLIALEINPRENKEGHFYVHTEIHFEPGAPGNKNIIDSFSSLSKLGSSLADEGKIREFRLRLEIGTEHFFISPVTGSKSLSGNNSVTAGAFANYQTRSQLFTGLTQREKQLLCFIYRGYKQSHIAFVYGITVETFKRHRKNIYRKMQFHNRIDLFNWCEKFLPDHLEVVRNLAVH